MPTALRDRRPPTSPVAGSPQVEDVEAVAELLLAREKPFREACDAADLRGERRNESNRPGSHGRPSRPAVPLSTTGTVRSRRLMSPNSDHVVT